MQSRASKLNFLEHQSLHRRSTRNALEHYSLHETARFCYRLTKKRMVSLLRLCADSIIDCLPCYPASKGKGDDASPKTVSLIVGFFFLVNYQMATGFLGIPFSFFQGGLLAGALTLLVIAFVSWVAAIWVLEVMARAQVRMHVLCTLLT